MPMLRLNIIIPQPGTCNGLVGSSGAYKLMLSDDPCRRTVFQLGGYLAARPTLRSLPSGMAVANVRLGQTYRRSRNGLPAEHTNWFNLVFYGDLATLAMEFDKGTNVYIEGSFDQRPMTDQEGCKRYAYEVTVQKFFRIGRA